MRKGGSGKKDVGFLPGFAHLNFNTILFGKLAASLHILCRQGDGIGSCLGVYVAGVLAGTTGSVTKVPCP